MKKSATLFFALIALPSAVCAQSNDDVIFDLLSSLDGPASPVIETSVSAPIEQPVMLPPVAVQTTPAETILTPFHLFDIGGNVPKPDPTEAALRSLLDSLTAQYAAMVASTQSATETTATEIDESQTGADAETETAPPLYSFMRNLSLGARGSDVAQLQEFLIARGLLFGEATGYFGILTKTALASFQSDQGIEPVGSLGPKTRTLINAMPKYQRDIAEPAVVIGPPAEPLIASSTSIAITQASSTASTSTPQYDESAPPVSVSMSILPQEVAVGGSVSVTWLSQNASSCIASDGWDGVKPTLGAAKIEPLQFSLNLVLTCEGAGGVASTSALVVVGSEE